ncbi:MAG: hypothetical protein LQ340_002966, partial [Diploschistes diacapsis]
MERISFRFSDSTASDMSNTSSLTLTRSHKYAPERMGPGPLRSVNPFLYGGEGSSGTGNRPSLFHSTAALQSSSTPPYKNGRIGQTNDIFPSALVMQEGTHELRSSNIYNKKKREERQQGESQFPGLQTSPATSSQDVVIYGNDENVRPTQIPSRSSVRTIKGKVLSKWSRLKQRLAFTRKSRRDPSTVIGEPTSFIPPSQPLPPRIPPITPQTPPIIPFPATAPPSSPPFILTRSPPKPSSSSPVVFSMPPSSPNSPNSPPSRPASAASAASSSSSSSSSSSCLELTTAPASPILSPRTLRRQKGRLTVRSTPATPAEQEEHLRKLCAYSEDTAPSQSIGPTIKEEHHWQAQPARIPSYRNFSHREWPIGHPYSSVPAPAPPSPDAWW